MSRLVVVSLTVGEIKALLDAVSLLDGAADSDPQRYASRAARANQAYDRIASAPGITDREIAGILGCAALARSEGEGIAGASPETARDAAAAERAYRKLLGATR